MHPTSFFRNIKSLNLPNLTMASPDTGGTRRAASYAKMLETGFVICYKQRAKPNVVESMELIGDVVGKDVILIDDIIDTAGSITKAAEVIMEREHQVCGRFVPIQCFLMLLTSAWKTRPLPKLLLQIPFR